MIHTTFWAIVVLGVLIFVHELGHFLLARFHGVKVLVFSLGFGPKIYVWRSASSGTEYCLSAIPLGGYVKMLGEGDEEPVAPEDLPYSFHNKAVMPRIMIVAAGPFFNFLFAFLALSAAHMVGVGELLPTLGSIAAHSPAEAAGLQKGDRVTYIDDLPVTRWSTLSSTIKSSEGRVLTLTVERDGKTFLVKITPQLKESKNIFGEPVRVPLIGVGPGDKIEAMRYGVLESMAKGWDHTWSMTQLTLTSTWKLITQVISADQIGGPLMIADMAGKAAEQGTSNLLFFMALISVNLAILNLLPVPVLDGGHLLFLCIEGLRGKPLQETVQMAANRFGMTVLLLLMIWALKNDLSRFFPLGQ
ncbi:RIP metalloprotease RseP [Candidatus Magnetaquicoccus inordinatus]|uniref:RIP metalloprotease RseP n=1 Tax=Candidatus Magnetaquicoccus inordinatus TaxID=2496818 RepID=UPI00102D1A04|nr:RIP metalloprotease RseP [Candidatus Magnetaquicoccus inordinatus]